MKTKTKLYDPYEKFRGNPEAQESVIKMYGKSQQPLARLAADVILQRKFHPAESEAQKTLRIARLLERLQTEFSKKFEKSDPAFLIEVPLLGSEGTIDINDDKKPYSTCWAGVRLIWPNPNILVLDKDDGGLNFLFLEGLPLGVYGVWLDCGTFVQKEVKIWCLGTADPTSAINPNTPVEKYTVPQTEQLLSGIDMVWEIKEADKPVSLCIMNHSGENLICKGAALLGCY